MKKTFLTALFASALAVCGAKGDILISGSATINYDQTAWNALASGLKAGQPVLTLSAFFDQAGAAALNSDQVLTNRQTSPSYTNEIYALNGSTVTNLSGRTTQPTTFSFTPGNLAGATGSIGLGGVARFAVSPAAGGGALLFGDYTLQYDASRIASGGSGWYLQGNIPPAGAVFDLLDALVGLTNDILSITGELGVSPEVAYALYNTPMDALAVVGSFNFSAQTAATVLSGSATINYDKNAWDGLAAGIGAPLPVLTLSAFFDQAQADALTYNQTLVTVQPNPSYTNEIYALNGPVVTNLVGRSTQPTTFAYSRGNLTNQTGSIGLGGIAQFTVSAGAGGGVLLFGDYTLLFDSSHATNGGSGWYLQDNVPPGAPVFELIHVSVQENSAFFAISGDLGLNAEIANLFFETPSDTLAVVGTFTFTGYTVPFSAPVIQPLAPADGGLILRATNGLPGGGYTLLTTTNLALPVSAWTSIASGAFDNSGASSNTIPESATGAASFYLLRQP